MRGHVASRSLRRRLKRSVGYAAPFGTSPASSDSTLHLRLASRLRRSPHAARRPRHSARPRVARRPHVGTAGPGSRGVPRAGRHSLGAAAPALRGLSRRVSARRGGCANTRLRHVGLCRRCARSVGARPLGAADNTGRFHCLPRHGGQCRGDGGRARSGHVHLDRSHGALRCRHSRRCPGRRRLGRLARRARPSAGRPRSHCGPQPPRHDRRLASAGPCRDVALPPLLSRSRRRGRGGAASSCVPGILFCDHLRRARAPGAAVTAWASLTASMSFLLHCFVARR